MNWVRAFFKYIMSQIFCAALVIGPWVFTMIASIVWLPENITKADWFWWVVIGFLIVSFSIMNAFVSPPKTLKQCLREEGLA